VLQQMRSAAKWIWILVFLFFVGGFLLLDTSGLLGRDQLTPSTAVATVNGVDVPYMSWLNLSNTIAQQREQGSGRGLSLDERKEIENQAFEQLVSEILLQQEYRRRGIRVSAQEIIEAAQVSPPPALMQSPQLQTDGQFDIEKYQRFLRSPQARQQGLLLQLESYYRSEIPRAKLFDQLAGDVYVPDAKLWRIYRDINDSVQVSFVTFDASSVADSTITISDAELRRHYDANRTRYERTGRGAVSLLALPRIITAADTAATRARAVALRDEIVQGATFEDVARRESTDSGSAANGGSLGMTGRGRLVPAFEKAAFALRTGELSQPVLTEYGFHLIRVDGRKADSIDVRHILLPIQQSDSSAAVTDRRADQLARIAASATDPQRFDSAAKVLGLVPQVFQVFEGQPVLSSHGIAPGVSAWAFYGARPGETSELFAADQAYFLARLDTLIEGGLVPFEEAKNEIRASLARRRKAESLVPRATTLAQAAVANGLEAAARAADVEVRQSPVFARPSFVAGMGRLNEAIGASFSLPVGTVSEPVVTDDGVFVIRVDRRVDARRDAWEAQKEAQRRESIGRLREARIRSFLDGMRERADVKDRRKQLNAAARQQAT
jgi:peptidyl-prolyl cis-trans isomerase D